MDELRAQHICWVLGLLFPLFLLAGRHLGESLSICAPDYEVGQGGIGSLYTVLSLPSQVQLIGLTRFRLCRTPEQRGWWPEDSWSWPLSVPCHEDAFFAYSRFTHLGLSTSFALFFFFPQPLSFNMKQRSHCGSVHQGKCEMGTELLCPWCPLAGSVSTLFVRNLLASYLVSLTRSQKSHSQSHELLSAGGFALWIFFYNGCIHYKRGK